MRFAIRSNGFDSDQHPIRNYLIRNGGRTSIRASGFPSWPSHLKGELKLATTKIDSTGDSDYTTIDSRVYNPDSETMLNDSDFNFSITYYPQLTNNNNSTSFRDSITNRVRIVAGGSVRDQYTPPQAVTIQSNNNTVPYDADTIKNEDDFTRDITVKRQVPTNVSNDGGGGGGGGVSTPGQIWY